MSTDALDRPSIRYRQLVERLGAECGNRYGWKTSVAKLLGVHPSHVSRILSGEQETVGRDAIARASERLNLDPEYFTSARDADWKEYREPEPTTDREASIIASVGNLDPEARARVVAYLTARWGPA